MHVEQVVKIDRTPSDPTAAGLASAPSLDIFESHRELRNGPRASLYRWLLLASDVIAVGLSVVLATSISDLLAVGLIAVFVIAAKASGLYDRDDDVLNRTTLEEVPAMLGVAMFLTLGITTITMPIEPGGAAALDLARMVGLLTLGPLTARVCARRVGSSLSNPQRCLLIGEATAADSINAKLAIGQVHAELIGRVAIRDRRIDLEDSADGDCESLPATPMLGYIEDLARLIDERSVDRVIIAAGSAADADVRDAIRISKSMGASVSVLPRMFELVRAAVAFDEIHGTTLLSIRHLGLTRSSRVLKRGFDLVAAGLVLLVAAPLLLAIGLLVRAESEGPALFRQRRVGAGGERFEVVKFRTMIANAEALKDSLRSQNQAPGGLFKIDRDPRITRVGRLLRQSSLDEMPQLLNVIRGEMSLVGPRPLVPDEDAAITGWDRSRLDVKPGMTGPWQIAGSARIPLNEMVKIDYIYAANWSLWADVKVLVRTFSYVLARRGQ